MITQQELNTLYFDDLSRPDVHHGRTTPKVRNIAAWEAISPFSKSGTFVDLAKEAAKGRQIFVWSDIHFGHKNIIKYSNRPFADRDQMTDALIKNYHDTVEPEDIVIFGGDIGGFGPYTKADAVNRILSGFSGYKIHIVGNHDFDHSGNLMELDMDERHVCLLMNMTTNPIKMVSGEQVMYQFMFTHYPMDTIPHEFAYNVHGHIHNLLIEDDEHINICVEHTNYRPVPLLQHFAAHTLKNYPRKK